MGAFVTGPATIMSEIAPQTGAAGHSRPGLSPGRLIKNEAPLLHIFASIHLTRSNGIPKVSHMEMQLQSSGPPPSDESLAVRAMNEIRRMIFAGVLPGGTVVQDRKLAEQLGLSRTPVREALGRLAGEGYLRRDKRILTVQSVSFEDVMEILATRRLIEGETARLAAGRMTLPRLAELRAAIEGMIDPREVSHDRHWTVDDLVHQSIAEASGNRMMARLVKDLRERTRMFGLSRIPRRFDPGKAEHLAIIAALEQGDGDAAARAMTHHIDNARQGILDLLAGTPSYAAPAGAREDLKNQGSTS
ncbi:MAG TPA: GntR family transcriptional regulator [Bosea sp. (in: a-proteobacteria)]|uniref:GntR family transcriptional regulator n=1 Tax=Bosea sp. (in: a-proteobacteria) TaxID=1871050 RepID=UPI002E0FC25F|nr:GntR family transcriptional regulator [Bosea sp. (in: a-proteobacteria)]